MSTEWVLAELMARHGIKGKDLATELSVGPSQISRWKREPPPLSPNKLDAIASAINELSTKSGRVVGVDLLQNFDQ